MLAQIDSLSLKEAEELYARLSFRLSSNRNYSIPEIDFWDALCGALHMQGSRDMDKAVTKIGVSAFRDAANMLDNYITEGSRLVMRRQVRQRLLRVVLDCLVDSLREQGEFITLNNVLAKLPTVAWAVEEAFPGYAGAGMLHRIAAIAQPH